MQCISIQYRMSAVWLIAEGDPFSHCLAMQFLVSSDCYDSRGHCISAQPGYCKQHCLWPIAWTMTSFVMQGSALSYSVQPSSCKVQHDKASHRPAYRQQATKSVTSCADLCATSQSVHFHVTALLHSTAGLCFSRK